MVPYRSTESTNSICLLDLNFFSGCLRPKLLPNTFCDAREHYCQRAFYLHYGGYHLKYITHCLFFLFLFLQVAHSLFSKLKWWMFYLQWITYKFGGLSFWCTKLVIPAYLERCSTHGEQIWYCSLFIFCCEIPFMLMPGMTECCLDS